MEYNELESQLLANKLFWRALVETLANDNVIHIEHLRRNIHNLEQDVLREHYPFKQSFMDCHDEIQKCYQFLDKLEERVNIYQNTENVRDYDIHEEDLPF